VAVFADNGVQSHLTSDTCFPGGVGINRFDPRHQTCSADSIQPVPAISLRLRLAKRRRESAQYQAEPGTAKCRHMDRTIRSDPIRRWRTKFGASKGRLRDAAPLFATVRASRRDPDARCTNQSKGPCHDSLYKRIYICIDSTMLDLRVSGFDWDEGNRAKCQKHGRSIAQIEALFARNPGIAPDHKHSADEDRLIAVGRITGGPFSWPSRSGSRFGSKREAPFHPPRVGAVHAREGGCRL
jgi:uncharacterized protein